MSRPLKRIWLEGFKFGVYLILPVTTVALFYHPSFFHSLVNRWSFVKPSVVKPFTIADFDEIREYSDKKPEKEQKKT